MNHAFSTATLSVGSIQDPPFESLKISPPDLFENALPQRLPALPSLIAHTLNDFVLECGQTLKTARAGWCVYATENGAPVNLSNYRYPEVELGRDVIVVLPALTGSAIAKVPNGVKCSQGDGWANHWIESQTELNRIAARTGTIAPNAFLDSDRYTILVIDHFGGNGSRDSTTSAKELFELGVAEQVTIADGVQLIATALKQRGLSEIHAVIGGSIGGGQAFHWMFQNELPVRHIVDISGSSSQDHRAREFFRIQRDLLSKDPDIHRLRTRTIATVSDLLTSELSRDDTSHRVSWKGQSFTPFEYVVTKIDQELSGLRQDSPIKDRLECARRLGFLLFVPPDFYQDKFDYYIGEVGNDRARDRLDQWLTRQGKEFSERFSPEALWVLCNMIAECETISPESVAHRMIQTGVKLIGSAIHGDTLFPVDQHRKLYGDIESHLYSTGNFQTASHLMSIELIDRKLGHDSFFDRTSFAPLGEIIRQQLN